jgi:ribosomal protein S12 methylthiotransferase
MTAKTFHLISLGCAKNTVDSDSMAQLLARTGYHPRGEAEEADVLVVNTCGFIAPAREESYQVLRELAANKRPGQLLIAAGCLTQRYGAAVAAQAPGVDGILGTRRWMDIVDLVQRLRCRDYAHGQPAGPICHLPDTPTIGTDVKGVMQVAVQGAIAYLKIADGCRRPCTFCAIPLIKGSLVSRPMEMILDEARALRDAGVREVILLAQDTTDYGHDLGMKDGLVRLLQGLVAAAPEMDWIRILYTFPGAISDALIETMAIHPQILPYLDIPLQHAHPDTLRRMGRPANVDWVYHTLEKMRLAMPDLSLRTTFIVGFPGETDEEFNTLLEFVREIRIDKMGAFQYSCESGTPAEPLGDPVPAEVKQARWEQLMTLQQGISLEKNQALVGRSLQVLVEGRGQVEEDSSQLDGEKEQAILVGRSYRDAPEIDGLVLVEGLAPDETVPDMIQVHITGAMAYDLVGQLILNK